MSNYPFYDPDVAKKVTEDGKKAIREMYEKLGESVSESARHGVLDPYDVEEILDDLNYKPELHYDGDINDSLY